MTIQFAYADRDFKQIEGKIPALDGRFVKGAEKIDGIRLYSPRNSAAAFQIAVRADEDCVLNVGTEPYFSQHGQKPVLRVALDSDLPGTLHILDLTLAEDGQRYADALPYALEAIRLRPQMFDRATIKATGVWTQTQSADNNFLYMGGSGVRVSPFTVMLSTETYAMFEKGDYVLQYDKPDGWSLSYGKSFSGLDGIAMYMGFGAQCNIYGLTSEQLRYVAAECLVRTGHITEGLQLADQVRALRVEGYEPFATRGVTSEAEAMALIQPAKWLEQIGTPFNFLDVKRWNSEPTYARTVSRRLGSLGTYRIGPDSKLWVMPFPANAVRYNDSLRQNY